MCTRTSSATRSRTTWSSGSRRSSATPTAVHTAGRSIPRSSRGRTTTSPPWPSSRPGTSAEIVRLAEHDGELLHYFYDEGLVPGTKLEVREPDNGHFRVSLEGKERSLDEKAAAGLFVRPG